MPLDRKGGGRFDRNDRGERGKRFAPDLPPKPKPRKRRPDAAVIAAEQASGREAFLKANVVSRETQERLDRFVALLTTWQARINLIAPATLGEIWTRHIADSVQLDALLPTYARLVDLGSGAGLPGLPLAALRPQAQVDLIESNGKKAAFLRTAAGELGLSAKVHAARIEDCAAVITDADIVTARALAPLSDLIALVQPHLKPGALCLFMKGEAHEQEIAQASAHWRFEVVKHDSTLRDGSVVLALSDLSPR